ncbi:MAG: hypothetical protein AB7F40_05345 [Victivallaceae bacterium]
MKALMKIGLSTVCAAFVALPLSAVELPDSGSYDDLAKLVPSDAVFAFYEDATAINESGWVATLRSMPNAAKLVEQKTENERGSVIVFGSGLGAGMPKITGLVRYEGSDIIDELTKAGETKEAALMPFEFEKFEQDGHRGMLMRIPGTPMDIRFMELAPNWLIFGIGGQGIDEYLKLPPDKLGINPELAALLEPNKDKMLFGALILPEIKKKGIISFEFFGDFSKSDAFITCSYLFVDEQKAVAAKRAFDATMPGLIMALDQNVPGISGLLGDAMTATVEGKNMTLTLTMPAEKIDKFIATFGAVFKAKMAAVQAQAAINAAAAAKAADKTAPVADQASESAPATVETPATQPEKETPVTE